MSTERTATNGSGGGGGNSGGGGGGGGGNRSRRGRGRRSRSGGGGGGGRSGAPKRDYLPSDDELEEEAALEAADDNGVRVDVSELKAKTMAELMEFAVDMNVENAAGMRKQDLLFAILNAQTEQKGKIFAEGVLEILQDGFGFLRAPDQNYLAGPDDVYVSPSQIRRFNLRTGDSVKGQIRSPKEGERYFALLRVETINFEEPQLSRKKILFDNLTPLYPQERFNLQAKSGGMTTRIVAGGDENPARSPGCMADDVTDRPRSEPVLPRGADRGARPANASCHRPLT